MSTKPSSLPRWAETTGGSQSNIVDPSSGQKDSGWIAGTEPPSQHFNWFQNLAYRWCQYLSDGALTGDHSFQKSAVGATPTVVFKDPLGNNRTLVDHLGFRMGQVSEFTEDWRKSGVAAPSGFTFTTVSGGATATSVAPVASMPMRALELATSTTNNSHMDVATDPLLTLTGDTVFVLEQMVRTGAAVDTGVGMEATVMLSSAADSRVWGFGFAPDASANVLVQTNTGSTVSSGVAIATDTVYRLRIEVLGDAMHAGSNTEIRFYINAALVHNFTTASGLSGNPFYVAALKNLTSGTDYRFKLGPLRMCWAQRASGDAL